MNSIESPSPTDEPEYEYCEFCEAHPNTTDRTNLQLAAFWMKSDGQYGQACTECADELEEHAPFETMVVHDLPGQYNYDEITETTHHVSTENRDELVEQLPKQVTEESQ